MRIKPGPILFWALTLGSLALALSALVFEPPALWVVVATMTVYVGFATLGVLVPQVG